MTRRIEKCKNSIHHHCKTPIRKEPSYRHSASASKCLECLWSMMTRSWCFSKKHSRADSGVRARLHLKLAFSHAQQKPLLWLSSLAKTKSTCRKRTTQDIFKSNSWKNCCRIGTLKRRAVETSLMSSCSLAPLFLISLGCGVDNELGPSAPDWSGSPCTVLECVRDFIVRRYDLWRN